jgi:restriction system-associated AAA family ATPase
MKLLKLKINKSNTCGGLLDELSIPFRTDNSETNEFSPLCLIGHNGAGKSQILQNIAEIFQLIFNYYLPEEESGKPNNELEFEIEYLFAEVSSKNTRVKITRVKKSKNKATLTVEKHSKNQWEVIQKTIEIIKLLPSKVIAYTSGDNETLSVPFFVSREGYAKKVAESARNQGGEISDPRMLLVDYGTNLEVLVANLLLNKDSARKQLLEELNLKGLNSFRCVIQLAHPQAPSGGVTLTPQLQGVIDNLVSCSTTQQIDENKRIYILDFLVDESTFEAFKHFWPDGALDLYSSFHKLAMLNDLVIPKAARTSFNQSIQERKFATRLPEPFSEHKVFRFERVEFISKRTGEHVDYVSMSDGEHQLAQILGMFCMAKDKNTLFLLDEPESHFNPKWRVEFISKLLKMQTSSGSRQGGSTAAMQDCLLTTHSPFVPSDMKRENVLIFKKDEGKISVRRPEIETFGGTFDAILQECFLINPAMSEIPKAEIERLLKSDNIDEITEALRGLGDSVDRLYLVDHVRALRKLVEA